MGVFQLSLSIDVRTIGRLHPVGVMEQSRTAILTRMQGSDCRNNAHTVMSILNTIQKNILSHKFRIRMKSRFYQRSARDHICSSKRE